MSSGSTETSTHQKLAKVCIQSLQSFLKEDICNLKMPGKARARVHAKDLDRYIPAHIQYACRHWASHLEQSKERIRDGDQVHMFLKCHFLHWLEALSLIGRMAESVTMVAALQTLVEVGDKEPEPDHYVDWSTSVKISKYPPFSTMHVDSLPTVSRSSMLHLSSFIVRQLFLHLRIM